MSVFSAGILCVFTPLVVNLSHRQPVAEAAEADMSRRTSFRLVFVKQEN